MAQKQIKKQIQYTKYIYIGAAFSLGVAITICFYSFTSTSQTTEDGAISIRKHLSSNLIAPLLMSGDTKELSNNASLPSNIQTYIRDQIRNNKALDISYYYRNLETGSWSGYHENDKYAPASLMKVPLMIAIFKQAESDPSLLSKTIYYDGNIDYNKAEYYKPKHHIDARKYYSIDELIGYMITDSDNNATTLLMSVVKPENLSDIYNDLGLPIPERDMTGTVDYMSSRLYSRLFRALYNATYLNEEFSLKAIKLLITPDFPEGLSGGIPSNIPIANKFGERSIYNPDGTLENLELHDCGIIYQSNTPYVLCVMTKGNDFTSLSTIIETISKKIYQEDKSVN